MIIDEDELKLDIIATIAQQLKVSHEEAKGLIRDNELEECIDLMYDAETDYINSLSTILNNRLTLPLD